ncbi:unnamed protein product [Prunus armeniaca]
MWLSTGVPKATQSLHVAERCGQAQGCRRQHKTCMSQGDVARHEKQRRLMAGCRRHRTSYMMKIVWVPKGTEEGENDISLLYHFPQTAPNC